MNCPACKETVLSMTERAGIEIDYCPKCRGVWLDRGELDKVIEKAQEDGEKMSEPKRFTGSDRDDDSRHYNKDYGKRYDKDDDHYKYKRKKSLLEQLFD
jgi:Zn-finger nucleic acid-binding protein